MVRARFCSRLRLPCVACRSLGAALVLAASAVAQTPDPEAGMRKLFGILDQDKNASIEGAEWDRIPLLRDWMKGNDYDLKSAVPFDEFADIQEEFAEAQRKRSGQFTEEPTRPSRGSDDSSRPSRRSSRSAGPTPPLSPAVGGEVSAPNSATPPAGIATQSGERGFRLKLPETYRPRDRNGDGQIGLYEWPRAELEEFHKLDRNGDGFVTPQELNRGTRPEASRPPVPLPVVAPNSAPSVSVAASPAAVVAAVVPQATASPAFSVSAAAARELAGLSNPAVSSKPATDVAATQPSAAREATPAVPPVPVPGGAGRGFSFKGSVERRGIEVFKTLDQNSDGSVTSSEWEANAELRTQLVAKGLVPSFPVDQAQFIEIYLKAYIPRVR